MRPIDEIKADINRAASAENCQGWTRRNFEECETCFRSEICGRLEEYKAELRKALTVDEAAKDGMSDGKEL